MSAIFNRNISNRKIKNRPNKPMKSKKKNGLAQSS